MQRWLPVFGRLMLAAIFLWSGYGKLVNFTGTTNYIASVGLPLAQVLAAAALLVELAGGAALVLGFKTRIVATVLFVFTLAAGLLFHAFWAAPAAQHVAQMVQFMKNLAICGGLLYAAAFGPGALSLDRG